MMNNIRILRDWMVWIFLFLLPWQTRWIVSRGMLAGAPWEQGTISIYATEILLIIVLFLWVIERRLLARTHASPLLSPIAPLALLPLFLISLALLRTGFARDFSVAATAALHLAEGIALFLLVRKIDATRASLAFLLGMIPAAGFGIWQFLVQSSPASTILGLAEHLPSVAGTSVVETAVGRYMRAYGPFPHPNIFGGYLVVALLLASRLSGFSSNIIRRFAFYSTPLFSAALVFTFSRSAWLAFLIGAGIHLFRRASLHWLAASTLTILIFGAIFSPLLTTRAASSGRLEEQSISQRQQGYRDAFALIAQHTWWGVAPGHASLAAHNLDPSRGPYAYEPVHNTFLLIWVELGLLGLISFLIFQFSILRSGFLPLTLALIIIGLFDHYLWSLLPGAWLIWLGLGISRS